MAEEIVNKVAQSGIIQMDLASFKCKEAVLTIDLKNQLWNEFVLKEKEFRSWINDHDWSQYDNAKVGVYCSSDAIIPSWAYMLVRSKLQNASSVYFGNETKVKEELFFAQLNALSTSDYKDKIVMVKGCSDIPNPEKAYIVLTGLLIPVVKTLMFGEPCSAVPVYKKK